MAMPMIPEPPGFDINADRAPLLIGVNVSMMLLVALAIGLRFYSRLLVKVPLRIDDWVILSSVVSDKPIHLRLMD